MGIDFEWRVALSRDLRDALQKKVTATLERWADTDEKPCKVIVSRPTFDPRDERVNLEILAESGKVLGAGQMMPPRPVAAHSSMPVSCDCDERVPDREASGALSEGRSRLR